MNCIRAESIPALHNTILYDGNVPDINIVKYDRIPYHTVVADVYLLKYD